ncbi:ferredoxin reductase-like protein [Ascodesmis nigricans]|uniref:NADH-cytochrome b5 reductase n=1 Tax=Ascodesmis nigricans TaxID=341454 RepID=A0A4S2N333_9PEZI|nr:ferredoxin reductase-like protein [Ascodesmis nigricans]
MFARTAFSGLRCARASPLRQTASRRFASSGPEEKKSSSPLPYILGAAAAATAGYYYYTQFGPKPLPPAVPTFTEANDWIDLKLDSVTLESPNTKRLRFALPSEDHISGLTVASCLLTKYQGPQQQKPVIRPYTPISDEDQRGYLDLIVKHYEGGPMSTHIHDMNVDQRLLFKGPIPKYPWKANMHEHIGLIAGGTGIAPMYQLIRAVLKNPSDKTKITLVFGNVTEQDILLKKELQELENTYPQRFKCHYILDNAPEGAGWATKGRVTKELLKTVLPEPAAGNNKIFVCGPPGMYAAISGGKKSPKDQGELTGILKELGYSKDEVFKF